MRSLKTGKNKAMLDAAHEMAQGLYDAGVIDALTLREFDPLCLPLIKELTPMSLNVCHCVKK